MVIMIVPKTRTSSYTYNSVERLDFTETNSRQCFQLPSKNRPFQNRKQYRKELIQSQMTSVNLEIL